MTDYNRVTLIGMCIRTPEMRPIGDDRVRTDTTISVNRPYKDQNGETVSDLFSVVAWGKLAEIMNEYVKKGEDILVDGRIQSRSYDRDGTTYWITEVIAENILLLGKKKNHKQG